MANYSQFKTDFWRDRYVDALDFEERYLLFYLKTSGHTNIAGFAELPVELMSVECKLPPDRIRTILRKLERDDLLVYRDGWLVLRTVDGRSNSEKIRTAIDALLLEAPEWVGRYIMRGEEKDERADHPAIVAVRDLTEKFPKKEEWDAIIDVLGGTDEIDFDFLVECHGEWSKRGYNPTNYNWVYEWYGRGQIPGKKRTNAERLTGYREAFQSVPRR